MMGSGKILKRAIEKYGVEHFRKEILFEAYSSEEMFTKEKELVVLGPQSYNLKEGGRGGFDHLLDRTDLKKKGYEKSKAAMTDPAKNSRAGTQTVMNRRGLFDPKYQEMKSVWAGATFRGNHHTEEAKNKIGAANKGRIPWNKGMKQTTETKEKIRQALLAYNEKLRS